MKMIINYAGIRRFADKHRYIAFVVFLELMVILWAFASLFGKKTTIDIDLSEADYYNGCNQDGDRLVISQSDNETGVVKKSAEYSGIELRPGRYEIRADYTAALPGYDSTQWDGEDNLILCSIGVSSLGFVQQLAGSNMEIYANSVPGAEPFWINSFTYCRNLVLSVEYRGYGDITIQNISISESVYYRFTRFIAILAVIAVIDVLVYIIFSDKEISKGKKICYLKTHRGVILAISAITFFSSLPVIYRYIYVGHDFSFHIARIAEIASGIMSGNFLVKIQPEMVNGYGYASPLFYPQLFLYIPALLYVAGFPLHTSYQIFVVIINLATCIICYYSIAKLSADKKIALLGSLLYTFSPYRLSELYVAGRLGEILSMVFFPLIIYGVYNLYKEEEHINLRACIPLVIGVSGVMQSHLVSILFTGIFLAIFVVMNIRKTFRFKRLYCLAVALIMVLLLNAWFIVPFLDSMDMDILVNNDGMLMFQGSGVYPIQIFSIFSFGKGLNVPMLTSNEFCLTMGVPLILGVLLFVYVSAKVTNPEIQAQKLYKAGKQNALFAVLTIVFSLWIFPWDEINNISRTLAVWLAKVEFSWRFLSVGAAFASFAAAAALCYTKDVNEKLYRGCILCMISLTVLTTGFFYADLSFEASGAALYSINNIDDFALGVTNDYQLLGSDVNACHSRNVSTTSDQLIVEDYEYKNGITRLDLTNTASEGFEKVIIPLFNYPGYKAYDSLTGEQYYIESGQNKKMMINIPAGYEGSIIVRYVEKIIWRVAELVSLIALVGFVVWGISAKRKGKSEI